MASVIGLAPIRPDLKDRLRELLCIHGPTKWISGFMDYWIDGHEGRAIVRSGIHLSINPTIHFWGWSPRLVSRQRLLVFSEALICLSYSGKWSSRQVTLLRLPVISR